MSTIVLLPHYAEASATPGLNKIAGLPDVWRPDIKNVQPRSFPTPFAIAETAAYHLERSAAGQTSPYQNAFEALVMGFVLGHLRLDLWNLVAEGGPLGSALSIIEPDSKYLGVLVDTQNANVAYGATDKHALFWPGARVTDAQWKILLQRINGDNQAGKARELLADFREVFRSAAMWDPDQIPWMRGLDSLIGQNAPSPSQRTLHEDSQFAGPLRLAIVEGAGTKGVKEAVTRVYLPCLKPGYAKSIREMCGLSFRSIPERNVVVALDAGNRDLYHIRVPNVNVGAEMLYLGAGTVRRTENVSVGGATGKIDLHKPDGIFSQLNSIIESIAAADAGAPSNERIQALPVFYPDVLRIPARLVRPSSVTYSPSVERLVQHGVSIPAVDALGELAVALPVTFPSGERKQAVYIERVGEHDAGDLRAVGYLLWLFFSGQAEVHGDQGPIRASSNLDALSAATEERPFGPVETVTGSVLDPRFQQDTRISLVKRLATFQRFVATYRQVDISHPGGLLARRAVEALSAWVFEQSGPLPALGFRSSRHVTLPLGAELKLPLYVDSITEVS